MLVKAELRHLEQTQVLPAVKVPLHLLLADGQSGGAAIYQAAHALAMAGTKGVDSEQMPEAAACAGCDCCFAPGLVPAARMPPWQARQAAPGMPGLLGPGIHFRMVQQAIHAEANRRGVRWAVSHRSQIWGTNLQNFTKLGVRMIRR